MKEHCRSLLEPRFGCARSLLGRCLPCGAVQDPAIAHTNRFPLLQLLQHPRRHCRRLRQALLLPVHPTQTSSMPGNWLRSSDALLQWRKGGADRDLSSSARRGPAAYSSKSPPCGPLSPRHKSEHRHASNANTASVSYPSSRSRPGALPVAATGTWRSVCCDKR